MDLVLLPAQPCASGFFLDLVPPAHAVDVVLILDFVAAGSRPDREQTAGSPMAGVSEGPVAGPPSVR